MRVKEGDGGGTNATTELIGAVFPKRPPAPPLTLELTCGIATQT